MLRHALILALALMPFRASSAEVPVLLSNFSPVVLPNDLGTSDVDFSVDLKRYIGIPDIHEPLVVVNTALGSFSMMLYPDDAPLHVENFLAYVDAKAYDHSIFHRNVKNFVIQGGGYYVPQENLQYFIYLIEKIRDPVPLEYKLPNAYGTLAMARTTDPNSATSEWYINTVDNSTSLAPNAGSAGYTVFGKVVGTGMQVVEALAALETRSITGTGFTNMPLINFDEEAGLKKENFVKMNYVRRATIMPDGSGKASVVSLSIIDSGTTFIARPSIQGSTLNFDFDPTYRGGTTVVVRAEDVNGNHVDLPVQVANSESGFTIGATIPLGDDITWSFTYGYLWERFYPWIWMFDRNEWWYIFGPSEDNLWVWSPEIGFIWTSNTLYPWVHIVPDEN